MIPLRIVWSVLVLVLGFMMPWWLFFALLCIGFLIFPYYVEGILLAGLFDAVFALPGHFSYVYTGVALVLFMGMYYLRRYLTFI